MPRAQSQRSTAAPQTGPQEPQIPQQAASGPEKQSIAGSWKLNRRESDDPRTKLEQAQEAGRNNGPYGNPRVGGPFPGSGPTLGGGPYGGNRTGWPNQNDADLQQMREFLSPADSITFVLKESEADLTDDQNRKSFFYTDGRKIQKRKADKNDKYTEIAAHWEGTRLVSDEKSPQGGELSRSFDLAPGRRQLYETVYFDGTRYRSSVVIHYIYDLAPEKP